MIRIIVSVIGLVAAGAIFFMYTQPIYDSAQVTNAQIAQYDAALQKATELQQLKQTLLSRYNTFNPNDVDNLQKLLPDHVDNVRLILDIDNLASANGMALQNVVVSTPDGVQSSQTAIGAIGSSKQKDDSLTLKFTTQGTYPAFKKLITDLEESLRIVDLVSLKITSGGAAGTAAAPPAATTQGADALYTYDITLKTYWLK